MPLNTVMYYVQGLLDQLPLPLGLGFLNAWITPPNPGDGAEPGVYVWAGQGSEVRKTLPRAQPGTLTTGGDKAIDHDVDCWLVWLGSADTGLDPQTDQEFPAIIDAVMACLRNTALLDRTVYAQDPVTSLRSQLINVGENMTYEYGPVRAVQDQRYLRYDARIGVTIQEWFQA